ncbi:MAG: 23S rRNA (uracil(1939)-C(5))-methyltransferase RlmD [Leptolyngbyaceae cyanobacterium bins.302]|nr:23S rRNA (uracil(1939)-C(5))-methyltransferase RlmD [Leptolyngbyaceae cyanobacterium bins.302]
MTNPHPPSSHPHPPSSWRQGELVDLLITDLSDSGDGVGRWEQRVIFVPDTVTGDRVRVRLMHVKPQYAHSKLHELLEPSPHRIRPQCIVADKCGGCQWQHVAYDYQLEVKRNLVVQALERIGGLSNPRVDPVLHKADLHYRNKATYPLRRAKSGKPPTLTTRSRSGKPQPQLQPQPIEGATSPSSVMAGYYQKGSHQLINLNQCPIQDDRLNPLLAEVKQDIQQRGWSLYDETLHRGKLRHLGLRIGRHTGEMLLTLVTKETGLVDLEVQAQEWLKRYPGLVGVALNLNPDRTNAIFGAETRIIAGRAYLHEIFAGITFQIRPDTFFQVNTEAAEALVQVILEELKLQGTETVLDAYCGVGTLTLPLAQRAQQAIGLEVQPQAIEQATLNAALNQLDNVTFQVGTVEALLPNLSVQPDIVVLDPPRKGCDRAVLEALLQLQPDRIVYMSCNAATLARDLKQLGHDYTLTRVQPADFFPQTPHVECVAFLVKASLE